MHFIATLILLAIAALSHVPLLYIKDYDNESNDNVDNHDYKFESCQLDVKYVVDLYILEKEVVERRELMRH